MPSFRKRPSAPLVISLLALFVALGGPAQAARLVRSSDVKNRSLQVRDLSRKAVKELQKTPRRSVGERALANRGVTTAKLRDGAVTASKIGASAVGSHAARPGLGRPARAQAGVGRPGADRRRRRERGEGRRRLAGRARHRPLLRPLPGARSRPSQPHECWSAEPVGLAPELAGADISSDLVLVTPDPNWPERTLAFTSRNSANRSALRARRLQRRPSVPTAAVEVGFRYVVIDIP